MWVVETKGVFEGDRLKPLAQRIAEYYVDNDRFYPGIECLYYRGKLGDRFLSNKVITAFEDELYSIMKDYAYESKIEKAYNKSNYNLIDRRM